MNLKKLSRVCDSTARDIISGEELKEKYIEKFGDGDTSATERCFIVRTSSRDLDKERIDFVEKLGWEYRPDFIQAFAEGKFSHPFYPKRNTSSKAVEDSCRVFAADEDAAIQHFISQGHESPAVEETGEFSSETGEKEFRLITDAAKEVCIVEYQDDDSDLKSEEFEGTSSLEAAFDFASNILLRDGERKVTITHRFA